MILFRQDLAFTADYGFASHVRKRTTGMRLETTGCSTWIMQS